MNLGHHRTVGLQAFPSYRMTHAEIKETQKRSERDVKENHIIITTSFRERASTGKTDFVQPEEHAPYTKQKDKLRHQAKRTEQRQCTED